jgi:hypothetical protein
MKLFNRLKYLLLIILISSPLVAANKASKGRNDRSSRGIACENCRNHHLKCDKNIPCGPCKEKKEVCRRPTHQTTKACENCFKNHRACSEQKPCERCNYLNINCVPRENRKRKIYKKSYRCKRPANNALDVPQLNADTPSDETSEDDDVKDDMAIEKTPEDDDVKDDMAIKKTSEDDDVNMRETAKPSETVPQLPSSLPPPAIYYSNFEAALAPHRYYNENPDFYFYLDEAFNGQTGSMKQ